MTPRRPVVLTVGMFLVGFAAFVLLGVCLGTLLIPGGTYILNGEAVTREDFLARAVPIMAPLAGLLLVLLYGLWKHKGWVPLLVVGGWTALGGLVVASALSSKHPVLSLVAGVLQLAVPAGTSLWVFFGYADVTRYYRRLSAAGQENHG